MKDVTRIYPGLNDNEVVQNRRDFGNNKLSIKDEAVFIKVLKDVVTEPMFILLLTACCIYFIVGLYKEALMMLVSILLIAGISFFQDYRSRNSIKTLKKIAATKVKLIRNGEIIYIDADEIVVNDIVIIEEGDLIPADGIIMSSNDFMVNESILTGESFAVIKTAHSLHTVFRGTLVSSGSAIVKVNATGIHTVFGKLGISLQNIEIEKTPLQIQIKHFVKYMVYFGSIAFVLVVGINYYQTRDFIASLLQGLTLAMSILPEEIPVALSTFQALGAFRLLKKHNMIVKQPQYVETLGSSTVICADKTGTITENKMTVAALYDAQVKRSFTVNAGDTLPIELIEYAMWSSESNPFDPMEKAIHDLYKQSSTIDKRTHYTQVQEYPLEGNPPFMTHVFQNENHIIIAAKGAPEAIIQRSNLNDEDKRLIVQQISAYAKMGYRVLGVGKANWNKQQWPSSQHDFVFEFLGLLAFQDPPKKNMKQLLIDFEAAGIQFKMITGDYPDTAVAIAHQINLKNNGHLLTGKEIMELDDDTLRNKVNDVNIFARMFPEAKLKVIQALKNNGEIVAMTGDGVNDAPALKAAHIGIAMGSRGSDVAKSASAIIITDDDIAHMLDAVALGRKIYENLKKAIQYILSIHIPIILIVFLPLFLGHSLKNIFSPVHVIFLELIMGPTCSIIYENEPIEFGTMLKKPRKLQQTFLSLKQLIISIIQGLLITAGCYFAGYYFYVRGDQENMIRSAVFITLLFSNIFLTLTNRSFYHSSFKMFSNKNHWITLILGFTVFMIFIIQFVPFVTNLFQLQQLNWSDFLFCFIMALGSTWWFEIYKWIKRKYF